MLDARTHTHADTSQYIAKTVSRLLWLHWFAFIFVFIHQTQTQIFIFFSMIAISLQKCTLKVQYIYIRRHKETGNSYKYDILASPSTRCIRNKNTNSVPGSLYHKMWLNNIYINKHTFNFNTVQTKCYVVMYQLITAVSFHMSTQLLLYHRQYNSRF